MAKAQRWPVAFLKSVVRETLREVGSPAAEVSLILTDDRRIQDLNDRYRGLDKPTDVLSFALEEGQPFVLPKGMPRQLGDVIVSVDTTLRHAQEEGNDHRSEIAWVICHGTLHLLGYDHQTRSDLIKMRERERAVLERLKIPRSWPELQPQEAPTP